MAIKTNKTQLVRNVILVPSHLVFFKPSVNHRAMHRSGRGTFRCHRGWHCGLAFRYKHHLSRWQLIYVFDNGYISIYIYIYILYILEYIICDIHIYIYMICKNISIVRRWCFNERAESKHIKKKTGWDSFPVKALILYGLNYWLSLGLSLGLSLKGHVWNMLEIYNH